jgi:hypothetical protein
MSERVVCSSGRIRYLKDGVEHRANGPAIYWVNPNEWNWVYFGVCNRYYGSASDQGDWTIHGVTLKYA